MLGALAEKVVKLLADKAAREMFRRDVRQIVETELAWDRISQITLEVY